MHIMHYKHHATKTALAVAILLACSQSHAAGFQLNEFSATGLGRAYAGEGAMADTAASASRNPATMTLISRPALSAGGIFVSPDVDMNGRSRSGRSLRASNIANSEVIPNIHWVQPINDQWWAGASATSNYGLATDFSDHYAAGSYGGTTDLMTTNLNLSTAWRISEHFSVGAGFDAVYAKAKINRYGGEQFAAYGFPDNTQITHLKGHRWGYGWNAGMLYEIDPNNRFGLTYRSEVRLKFKGNYRSDLPSAFNPVWQQAALYGTDGSTIPGRLNLTLPDTWEVSGWHKVAPKWAIHYSMAYTNWSSFEQLKATGADNNTLFQKEEHFKNAWRMALGTTYHYDDDWTFRGGVAFDDSPVNAKYRSISIPDQDRVWLTTGASYRLADNASMDLGVAYMHGQNVTVKEGAYSIRSKGRAWLYGAGFNYQF